MVALIHNLNDDIVDDVLLYLLLLVYIYMYDECDVGCVVNEHLIDDGIDDDMGLLILHIGLDDEVDELIYVYDEIRYIIEE